MSQILIFFLFSSLWVSLCDSDLSVVRPSSVVVVRQQWWHVSPFLGSAKSNMAIITPWGNIYLQTKNQVTVTFDLGSVTLSSKTYFGQFLTYSIQQIFNVLLILITIMGSFRKKYFQVTLTFDLGPVTLTMIYQQWWHVWPFMGPAKSNMAIITHWGNICLETKNQVTVTFDLGSVTLRLKI